MYSWIKNTGIFYNSRYSTTIVRNRRNKQPIIVLMFIIKKPILLNWINELIDLNFISI